MIDLDALRRRQQVDWKAARSEPGAARPFLLAAEQPDRSLPLPEELPEAPAGAGRRPIGRRRAADRGRRPAAWAERLWRRWGRRCRSTNKYFEAVAGRTMPGAWRRATSTRRDSAACMADPDAPFRDPGATDPQGLADDAVAETTMIVRGRPTAVIYKRFNRKKWLDPILNLFRPSRAWRSWQAGQDLVSRGIPTPQNLASVARRPYGRSPFLRFLPHETYLITRQGGAGRSTWRPTSARSCRRSPADVRRTRIRRLTRLAGPAGPIAARAVAVAPRPQGRQHPDPDRHDRRRGSAEPDRPGRRPAAPPAALEASGPEPGAAGDQPGDVPGRTRTDALRFLRLYLPWGLSPLNDWKAFWRSIERAMRTKRSRNLRRGRPLS